MEKKETNKKDTKKVTVEDKKKVNKEETKKVKKKDDEIVIRISKNKLIKGIWLFVSVALLIGITAYASTLYTNNKNNDFVTINVDRYLELLDGEELSIIYVARPTCSYCVKQKPILKKVADDYNLKIYYLDTTNFVKLDSNNNFVDYSEDGYKFLNSDTEVYGENGYGTPNTILVQNGSIVDGVYGYVEADELISLFDDNGLIK